MEDANSEAENLYEHFSFQADKGQNPLRIDKFLQLRIEHSTRNKIQQAAKAGSIHANGISVKPNYKVKAGDQIQVLFKHPPYENLLLPESIPLDIVYEDNAVVVINKAPGLVVHPGHGNYSGTLVNGLLHHFSSLPKNASNRPGLVHRIDKDTSGLLVVAKTEHAMSHLALQFSKKTSKRKYVALVWGDLMDDTGTIDVPIGRNPKNRLQMTTFQDDSSGKKAVTHYHVLERFGYTTLISCELETGRTHQIRVHMKSIGHTLFNDERYGGNKILKGTAFSKYKQFVENCFALMPRQALHAQTLGFTHPETEKEMLFEIPIPQDFDSVITKWRDYAKHRK